MTDATQVQLKPDQRPGALAVRYLDDGRELTVYPMIYTTRLCIGPADSLGYDDAWCFKSMPDCLLACAEWDGQGDDPPGRWIRHINSGRRRSYTQDGQLEREWIEL